MKKDEPESTKYLTDDDCFWAWYSLWLKKVSEEEPWLVSGGKTKIKWKRYIWERKKPKRIQLCLPHLLIYLFFFFCSFGFQTVWIYFYLNDPFGTKWKHTLSLSLLFLSLYLWICEAVFLFWNKISFCVCKTVKGVKKQLCPKICTFFFYYSYCNSSLIVSHVFVFQGEKITLLLYYYIYSDKIIKFYQQLVEKR